MCGMMEFEAYAADCRLHGRLEIGDRRLTDALNAAEEVTVRDVRLESLSDGHTVEMPELTARCDELYAAVGDGRRGEPGRRIRTHATRVQVVLGPYCVEGALHGFPAGDPLGMVMRRPSWLPLTDAIIEYSAAGAHAKEEHATLLVNRDLATSLRALDGEPGVLRWESVNPLGGIRHRVEQAASPGDADATSTAQPEPAPPAQPVA